MKKHKKSQNYYEALDKAFASLTSKSSDEFYGLLNAQNNSEVTKLLMGYASANEQSVASVSVSYSVTIPSPSFSDVGYYYNPHSASYGRILANENQEQPVETQDLSWTPLAA